MQYLAAYTLATLSGKEPTEQTLNSILSSTGKPIDAAQVKAVVASLKGKSVHELITKGQSKIGSGSASAAPAKKDDKKKQEKKEEKKPEPKKEQKKPEPEPEQENYEIDLFG